jgi:hypothetical protein
MEVDVMELEPLRVQPVKIMAVVMHPMMKQGMHAGLSPERLSGRRINSIEVPAG